MPNNWRRKIKVVGAKLVVNGWRREPIRATKMSLAPLGHIEVDERGVPRVAGSRTKVTQIVLDKRAHGWSPEEIQSQYSHLSLADVHAAMAFYYDHQAEIDAQLERDRRDYERLRATAGESAVVQRLRTEGKLP